MDNLTTKSARDDSYDEMLYPTTAPTFFQDLYDLIKFEPINGLLETWEGGHNLKHEAKTQTSECSENFGWSSSLHSSDKEPWELQYHELLPDHSAYSNWLPAPTDNPERPIVCQPQCVSPSAEQFSDRRVSLFAGAPLSRQTCGTPPVTEIPLNIDSPQYRDNYFRQGSLAQNCLQPAKSSDIDSLSQDQGSLPEIFGVMQAPVRSCQSPSQLGRAKSAVDSLPYSRLLHKAFVSSNTRELSLHQIYEWFEENTNKAADNKGKDWRSSIRHNLSINEVCRLLPRIPTVKYVS